MVGWHQRLNGHEFEQIPGVRDGQGGLACCSPWGHNESDMTERLNCTEQKQKNIKKRWQEYTENLCEKQKTKHTENFMTQITMMV